MFQSVISRSSAVLYSARISGICVENISFTDLSLSGIPRSLMMIFLRSLLSASRRTNPPFSSLSIIAVTAPVVSPVALPSSPAVAVCVSLKNSKQRMSVECIPVISDMVCTKSPAARASLCIEVVSFSVASSRFI